jgi:hypothetical protein
MFSPLKYEVDRRLSLDCRARSKLYVMSSQVARPLGYPSDGFFVVEDVPYWKSCDYYDFVVVKVVSEFACG